MKFQNQWQHGPRNFDLPDFDLLFGPQDGLFPLEIILDPKLGQEVVLFLRDQTPFMHDLKRLQPFQLFLKAGIGRNKWGPVPFFLFWVPSPEDNSVMFVGYDLFMNPNSPSQVQKWRALSNQTHWHLFLVGRANEQENFFEFENTFRLDDSLDGIQAAGAKVPMIDFDRARAEFMANHQVTDLFRM
jgi:hypothetical protein